MEETRAPVRKLISKASDERDQSQHALPTCIPSLKKEDIPTHAAVVLQGPVHVQLQLPTTLACRPPHWEVIQNGADQSKLCCQASRCMHT